MADWTQASFWGILTSGNPDDGAAAFNAGHLNDVLRLDETPFSTILVAGETSGVWLVNQTGGVAIPLGDSWALPNLNSLARGVHGSRHIYAGGDALYETDVTQFAPLFSWREISILGVDKQPIDVGGIIDIVAIQARSKLVLACGGGVFWADIPAPGGNYVFKQVAALPAGAYSGAAEGPRGTVVVAAWGSDNINHFGLFYGNWLSGDLVFARSAVFGNLNEAMMLRTSLDSCRGDSAVMYAVAGIDYKDAKGQVINDTIYRVLKSANGGRSWRVTGSTVTNASDPLFGDPTKNLPGNQQDWNNCIAASPMNPRRVALGWRNGYFFSTNAGATWEFVSADSSAHLHSDLHAVAFDQFDTSQQTLYICSDGGLATTRDLGSTHESLSNRQLPNLQFYRLASSPRVAGLLSGSLQDNGDEYCTLYPDAVPWKDIDGGDGNTVAFIENGRLIYYNNTLTWGTPAVEFGNRVRDARWDPNQATFQDVQEFPTPPLNRGVIPVDGTNDGLAYPITEVVTRPTWRTPNHELMVAVAGKDVNLYGLFLTSAGATHWTLLGAIPAEVDAKGNRIESITAVGSGNGEWAYVGTDKGRIFNLSSPGWTSLDISPSGNGSLITGLAVHSDNTAFATASGQKLFRSDGLGWDILASPPGATSDYTAVETNGTVEPKVLFLATDNRVYSSPNGGPAWDDISAGLPETPHCRDLRFETELSGTQFLYLATYGRSAFRRLLNAREDRPQRVSITGKMDLVDRVAIGHDIWAHPNFANTASLDANHPIEDITITETDGDEVKVELAFHLQWFIDNSVDVQHTVKLISMDENNAISDQKAGSFKLGLAASRNTTEDLVSDEFWPDRAHIDFTVTNA